MSFNLPRLDLMDVLRHDVVIVEGSKYAGKSTFCREILKPIGYAIYRTTRRPYGIKTDGSVTMPFNMNIEDATPFVLDYLVQNPARVAFDRSLISSAWFQRDRPGMAGRLDMMVKYLQELKGIVVHLHPEWESISARHTAANLADVEGSNVPLDAIKAEREGILRIIQTYIPENMVVQL